MRHDSASSSVSSSRTAIVALRTLGVFSGGLGLYLAYLAYGGITGMIRHIGGAQSVGELVTGIVFDVLLALVAIWCMVSTYQSCHTSAKPPVRSLSAILAIFLLAAVVPLLERSALLFPGLTVDIWWQLLSFGAVALTCALYVSLTWWFSSTFAIAHAQHRIPPFVVVLVCMLLWLTSFEFLCEVMPKEPGYEYVPRFPWGLVALAVPIAMAIFVGRILLLCGTSRDKHNGTQGVTNAMTSEVTHLKRWQRIKMLSSILMIVMFGANIIWSTVDMTRDFRDISLGNEPTPSELSDDIST